jgi:hypothetical protein
VILLEVVFFVALGVVFAGPIKTVSQKILKIFEDESKKL